MPVVTIASPATVVTDGHSPSTKTAPTMAITGTSAAKDAPTVGPSSATERA